MRTESREILAIGIFGHGSRIADRIEMLLRRGRTFSPRASGGGVAASALILGGMMLAGSVSPRWIAFAQQEPRPQFAVASIKVNAGGAQGVTFAPMAGGRLTVENNPITNLIGNAYGIRGNRILGGPAWANSDRFDIEARADGSPDKARLMLMLQTLLEDRFKLRVHRETREAPVFHLVAARGGIKLQPWREGSCVTFDPFNPSPARPAGETRPHCGNNLILPKGSKIEWTATKIDMTGLAGALAVITRRPVIDKTSFAGTFDIHLELPNDPGIAEAVPEDAGPSLFTLLQEQLGLKLESTKGPVDVLVIDHVEKPDAN